MSGPDGRGGAGGDGPAARTAPAPGDDDAPPRPRSLGQLFLVFTGLALRGFGGVLPWAQRVLVEERRWLTREQFVEMLAFGQLLPGPNVCNVALMAGDRWFGWRGAVVALAGMLAAPAAVVLTIAVAYGRVADDPIVRRALIGMGAVAGGMILGTALRLAAGQRAQRGWLVFGVAAFVGVALLRLKLLWVVAALCPVAVAAAWVVLQRHAAAAGGGR
jgi:chromate transporter